MQKPLSYIEISKSNLTHNILLFRKLIHPHCQLGCVVKANAYGHGQAEVVKILNPQVDLFWVDDFQEFTELKKFAKKPMVIIGYVSTDELSVAMQQGAIFVVYDTGRLGIIEAYAKKHGVTAHVHVKLDAQLGRQGIMLADLPIFISTLKKYPHIAVDAVYAHFANIEDTNDFSHANKQIEELNRGVELLRVNGFKNFKTHMSSSSGILAYEQGTGVHSLVRLGISTYGLWPSENLRKKYESKKFSLQPTMRWISHVAQVKTLPKGYTVGYGLTYKTNRVTKIAVIPQGYSDGYDRGLSNKGEVLIKGKRCKVLGRVSMNMFTVDVTHIKNIQPEDEVVLLGKQCKECISAEEIAEKIGTINYEVVARVSSKIPRIVV